MSLLSEARSNLQIALRLARFDKQAAEAFPDDDRSVWRSFWAAPLALIFEMIASAGLASSEITGDMLSSDRAPLSVGWVAVSWLFALNIAAEFARLSGKAERWPRYVVAYNWAAAVQRGVLALCVVILTVTGGSAEAFQLLIVVAMLWTLAFDWHVARTALDIGGAPAALLIVLLLAASFVVLQIAASVAAG